jgi:hypothetical protein
MKEQQEVKETATVPTLNRLSFLLMHAMETPQSTRSTLANSDREATQDRLYSPLPCSLFSFLRIQRPRPKATSRCQRSLCHAEMVSIFHPFTGDLIAATIQ